MAHASTRSNTKLENKDNSAHEPVVKGSIAHEHTAEACIDHDQAAATWKPPDVLPKPLNKLTTAYSPSDETKKFKQITKAKSLDILAHCHETRGHRSPE